MSAPPTTYDQARDQIAPYVAVLTQGAMAMPFEVRDQDGRVLRMTDDHLSGKPFVLVLVNQLSDRLLTVLSERADDIESSAALVLINAADDFTGNRELARRFGLRCAIGGDSTGAVFASFGLHKGNDVQWRIVVMTRMRQIRGWIDAPTDEATAIEGIMEYLKLSTAAEEARWEPPHAPVLQVPNVLSRDECKRLIDAYEGRGPFTVRPPRPGEFDGDYKIPVYEHNRQDRIDHIIKDPATQTFLDERIFSRIVPMIQKAFSFDVNRREDLHIARYTGKRAGNQMGHRDNVSQATSYRRFALSMNLNDDFEGGDVVFNEFSPRGYRGEPGTALIFSSSLLHEIMETTSGTRYSLISHLFNAPQ